MTRWQVTHAHSACIKHSTCATTCVFPGTGRRLGIAPAGLGSIGADDACAVGPDIGAPVSAIAGWTLQEFCAARKLVVRTESPGDAEASGGLYSVVADEEALFIQMRERHQIADSGVKKPVWIYGAGIDSYSDEEMTALEDHYLKLSSILHTSHEKDMIRALYPIIWGRPVESQEELMKLVDQVAHRTQAFHPREARGSMDLRLLKRPSILTHVPSQRMRDREESLAALWSNDHRSVRETASDSVVDLFLISDESASALSRAGSVTNEDGRLLSKFVFQ